MKCDNTMDPSIADLKATGRLNINQLHLASKLLHSITSLMETVVICI